MRFVGILNVTVIVMLVSCCIVGCQNQNAVSELEGLKNQIKIESEKLESNKAIVRRAHEEVWSKGNMDVVDDLYAPNYVAHWVVGDDTGLDEFKKMIIRNRTAFPDMREDILHILAEGDLVITHFTNSGTFKGELDGIPPTGKKAINPEVAIHRIENGKIVEQWTFADRLNLLDQLGIEL